MELLEGGVSLLLGNGEGPDVQLNFLWQHLSVTGALQVIKWSLDFLSFTKGGKWEVTFSPVIFS